MDEDYEFWDWNDPIWDWLASKNDDLEEEKGPWKITGNFHDGKNSRLYVETAKPEDIDPDPDLVSPFIFYNQIRANRLRPILEKVFQYEWSKEVFAKVLGTEDIHLFLSWYLDGKFEEFGICDEIEGMDSICEVLRFLLVNPEISIDDMCDIFREDEEYFETDMILRPLRTNKFAKARFKELSEIPYVRVHMMLAANRYLPSECFEILSESDNRFVIDGLTRNRNLPESLRSKVEERKAYLQSKAR